MQTIDPVSALKKYCAKFPSQTAAAAALGISPQYLTDLLYGRRDLSARVLDKLNLQQVVIRKKR